MYTGWVNEDYDYVQGQGGEGLRLGNIEDEDDNRDNNEGREGKGGTKTMPSTSKNATRKDKKMSATTTAAYYYYFSPPQMDLSLVPMLLKIWDSLMGKCLAQHLELQMESHLELMKELSWVLHMNTLVVIMKENLRVPCLDLDWDKKLVLHLDLLMVLWTDIKMACWMAEHSGSYLVHLMDLCLAMMKASYSSTSPSL